LPFSVQLRWHETDLLLSLDRECRPALSTAIDGVRTAWHSIPVWDIGARQSVMVLKAISGWLSMRPSRHNL
jgi:hypothetical protein